MRAAWSGGQLVVSLLNLDLNRTNKHQLSPGAYSPASESVQWAGTMFVMNFGLIYGLNYVGETFSCV